MVSLLVKAFNYTLMLSHTRLRFSVVSKLLLRVCYCLFDYFFAYMYNMKFYGSPVPACCTKGITSMVKMLDSE